MGRLGEDRSRTGCVVTPDGYELDIDTALTSAGHGRYEGELVDRWNVGVGMNGGYLAVFCLRAVLLESALPDPLSMTPLGTRLAERWHEAAEQAADDAATNVQRVMFLYDRVRGDRTVDDRQVAGNRPTAA